MYPGRNPVSFPRGGIMLRFWLAPIAGATEGGGASGVRALLRLRALPREAELRVCGRYCACGRYQGRRSFGCAGATTPAGATKGGGASGLRALLRMRALLRRVWLYKAML